MSITRCPEDVLARIPGWQEASFARLDGGITNRSWLVDAGGRKGVLKIDDRERSEPFNTRRQEATIQAVAAGQGLAPPVLYVDETALLTEFVDGDVWVPGRLADADNITLLGETLRRVHALPLSGRSFDATIAAHRYVARIEHPDASLVAECTETIESMRLPHNLCCCHNDLVVANMIATPDLKFLDWEYACDNDPMFDLATIVEHHELGDDLASMLLDAYFDGTGDRWHDKLRQQQRLYRALYWLWLASRPDTRPEDLSAAASRLAGVPRIPGHH